MKESKKIFVFFLFLGFCSVGVFCSDDGLERFGDNDHDDDEIEGMLLIDPQSSVGGYSSLLDPETFRKEVENSETEFADVHAVRNYFGKSLKISSDSYLNLLLYFLDGRREGADYSEETTFIYSKEILEPLLRKYIRQSQISHSKEFFTVDDFIEDVIKGKFQKSNSQIDISQVYGLGLDKQANLEKRIEDYEESDL